MTQQARRAGQASASGESALEDAAQQLAAVDHEEGAAAPASWRNRRSPDRDRPPGALGADGAARVLGWLRRRPSAPADDAAPTQGIVVAGPDLDLAADDPLFTYLLDAATAVDITDLQLQSATLKVLQDAGVVLLVPLISSGRLVGLLSLGPRRSGPQRTPFFPYIPMRYHVAPATLAEPNPRLAPAAPGG